MLVPDPVSISAVRSPAWTRNVLIEVKRGNGRKAAVNNRSASGRAMFCSTCRLPCSTPSLTAVTMMSPILRW